MKNSAGLLPRSANCGFMNIFERRSQAPRAFVVRDEVAVRTHTLIRRLHAHATVDGYRNDQFSGQSSLVAGAHVC